VLTVYERRRIAVVLAATLLALPALRLARGGDDGDAATVATSMVVPAVDGEEVPAPVILGGPPPVVQDGSAQIAYPSIDAGVQGTASFSNFNGGPSNVCWVPSAPLGQTLTVTNLNNGRSATCVNVLRESMPPGATMVLHTKVYEALSDLAEVPIPIVAGW